MDPYNLLFFYVSESKQFYKPPRKVLAFPSIDNPIIKWSYEDSDVTIYTEKVEWSKEKVNGSDLKVLKKTIINNHPSFDSNQVEFYVKEKGLWKSIIVNKKTGKKEGILSELKELSIE